MNVTNPVIRFTNLRGRTGRFVGSTESSFRIFSSELTKKVKKSPPVFADFQKTLVKHTRFKVWINKKPRNCKSPSVANQVLNESNHHALRFNYRHQRHYSAVKRSITPISPDNLTIKKLTPSTPRTRTKLLKKTDLKAKHFSPVRGPTPNPEPESLFSSSSSETLKSRLYTNP